MSEVNIFVRVGSRDVILFCSISFTVVSDPEEGANDECVELGVAELDILEVCALINFWLQTGD